MNKKQLIKHGKTSIKEFTRTTIRRPIHASQGYQNPDS
jgi:hypothetical protein